MNNPINAVADYGADPTGATDSTAALQAAINAGIAAKTNVWIPGGNYQISAPLVAGTTASGNNTITGWKLYGDGAGETTITLNGAGPFQAILQIGSSLWRDCEFSDMMLTCSTPQSASYGFLFNSTEFSNHTVARIVVNGAQTAFGILQGTGGNGEFVKWDTCIGNNVNCLFSSNAGQAYVQRFDHCGGQLNYGGTWFVLNMNNGGGGFRADDFNGSATQQNGISNTTLLSDNGSSSPIIFTGGRIEGLTRLIANPGGSPDNGKTVLIEGMELAVDYDPTNSGLAFTEWLQSVANADTIKVDMCKIEAQQATCTLPIWAAGGWGSVVLARCDFCNFAMPPYFCTSGYDEFQEIAFRKCRVSATGTADRMVPLDRSIVVNRAGITPMQDWERQQWIAAGMPGNLLASQTLSALAPGQSESIAIPSIDLSLAANGRQYQGDVIVCVDYEAEFTELGPAAGTIALVGSVSGQVFDQIQLRSGGALTAPVKIKLGVATLQRATSETAVLKITNTDPSKTFNAVPAWQYAEVPT